MTRDEFERRLRHDGGFRVRVRLLSVEEGGRQTPLFGEYRPNWSIESDDPKRQAGGPIFIDDDQLRPGEEGDASLIPLTRETWEAVTAGTSLTGFEGNQVVARAVVLSVATPE